MLKKQIVLFLLTSVLFVSACRMTPDRPTPPPDEGTTISNVTNNTWDVHLGGSVTNRLLE